MKRSKTSRPYATVPKLRVKAKKLQYEEPSAIDDIGNVATSNPEKLEKDLLLDLSNYEELTNEESINDENEKQDSNDKDSTYEKYENSPERTINEVQYYYSII